MVHRCPICNKIFKASTRQESEKAVFFPFCSNRCKLIDLGDWLDARYKVIADPQSDEPTESPVGWDNRVTCELFGQTFQEIIEIQQGHKKILNLLKPPDNKLYLFAAFLTDLGLWPFLKGSKNGRRKSVSPIVRKFPLHQNISDVPHGNPAE